MARHDRTRLPAAERRRQIITAATRLVAERGFWGLSMQDVATACGLTVPGLLHHVGSKDGLLIAILEHRDAEDARALDSLLAGPSGSASAGASGSASAGASGFASAGASGSADAPGSTGAADSACAAGLIGAPGATLREVCAAVVRRNASQPEIVRLFAVLQAESLTPDHPAHDYFVARQQRILNEITALAKTAGTTVPPETTARRIIALMDGVQLQWLRSPGSDLVQLWAATADGLLPD
ncbi:helix-turn-helix domain-containing protein [Dactylosporangium sp. NPDC050588]|uniref:helix-turn-helix domain-containing protein n=1 Tax=Dactylosporangium sp. NPDC050588 TaxID=3157211 RepID=UPI0033D72290